MASREARTQAREQASKQVTSGSIWLRRAADAKPAVPRSPTPAPPPKPRGT